MQIAWNALQNESVADDTPWFLWTKKWSVFQLSDEKQTEGRFVEGSETDKTAEMPINSHPIIPPIQRNQYNAVLNRMEAAKKHSSTFSAWNT